MTDNLPVNNQALIEAISSQLPLVTEEQVAMVLDAWNTVVSGDPVGTIVSDPETGSIAVRVSSNGIHQWQVTDPNGGSIIDRNPTLTGWTVIRAVEAAL